MTPPALIWNLVLKPQGIQLRFFLFFPTDLWGHFYMTVNLSMAKNRARLEIPDIDFLA
jgi:hypothetical protein